MSSFQLSANHIALLVDARISIITTGIEGVNRDRMLVMLESENRANLLWESDARGSKRAVPKPIEIEAFPAFNYYVIRDHGVLKILKALLCYEYQCCDHPKWDDSDAARFCAELKDALIARLPGYDKAEGWGFE